MLDGRGGLGLAFQSSAREVTKSAGLSKKSLRNSSAPPSARGVGLCRLLPPELENRAPGPGRRDAQRVLRSKSAGRIHALRVAGKQSAAYIKRVSPAQPSAQETEKGAENADRAALHQRGTIALRGHHLPPHHERNPQSGRLGRLPADDVEVPEAWSQVASDVLAQKYFRKAGVPARLKKVEEDEHPVLPVAQHRRRDGARRTAREGALRRRNLRKQVFDRLAGTWTYWGWKGGYFDTEDDAQAFFDETALHAGDADGARPTRRNGSTPACIGPMASTGRARATTTSTTRPAS